MPYDGQPGTAKDGTPVIWNAALGRAIPASASMLAKAPGPPGPAGAGGTDALRQTQVYRDARAKGMAKADEKAQENIDTGLQDAQSNATTLGLLRDTVKQAPTGSFANTRQSLGKNFGNVLGGLPFIPTKEEATALANLKTLTSERTLGDVSKLKGPLSDKDVQFLARMQVDPYESRQHNEFVANLQSWANDRKREYYDGMQSWMNSLGSPAAKNRNGLTYNQWWAQWSEANMPRPDARVPSRRETQNADLKRQSGAAKGGPVILSVSN